MGNFGQNKGESRQQVMVVGGGRFGRLALERLGARITMVVEPQPGEQLRKLAGEVGAELVMEQGAIALSRVISIERPPVWVVPAVPRHLLMDWLLVELRGQDAHGLEVPRQALPPEPHLTPGTEGQMFLSLADFLCPDDCPEPVVKCTVTDQPRGTPLYKRLAEINYPGWHTGVVRSYQLAPGVGGCRTDELVALHKRIATQKGRWLLATACRCHGVVGAMGLTNSFNPPVIK